ncbi:hypothetical protein GCM10009429_10160 [Dyella marensis]
MPVWSGKAWLGAVFGLLAGARVVLAGAVPRLLLVVVVELPLELGRVVLSLHPARTSPPASTSRARREGSLVMSISLTVGPGRAVPRYGKLSNARLPKGSRNRH